MARTAASDRVVREVLPLIYRVEKGPPCFLNSFENSSLGAAEFNLSHILNQRFRSEYSASVTEPLYCLIPQDQGWQPKYIYINK